MKKMAITTLLFFGLSTSIAGADMLGDADDTYLGFHMTAPVDFKSRNLFSSANEYRYLLIRQKDGVKDGLVLALDDDGGQTLNYLRPSTTLELGESNILDYAIPVLHVDTEADENSKGEATSAIGTVFVLVALGAYLKNELEKPWKPASPD